MGYWQRGFSIETKPDKSLVTEADKAVERLFRDRLRATYPNDGIVGEEYGSENLGAGRIWVIDPIDGTQAFILGIPVFSTLIATLDHGKVTQAVADFPAMDLRFTAAKGAGAYSHHKRLKTSFCEQLSAATLTATSTTMFTKKPEPFERLVEEAQTIRYGLDAFGYCNLARGRIDLAVEACLKPYDYLAPSLIVTEAGGCMTTWHGAPLGLNTQGDVVAAATPVLHAHALECLQVDSP